MNNRGKKTLYRLESEAELQERIRQEARSRGNSDSVVFPDQDALARVNYPGRSLPGQQILIEPPYTCHRRLLFEEKNAERYGWDFGFIQPALSTAYFYKDLLFFPAHFGSYPHRRMECTLATCLAGRPGALTPFIRLRSVGRGRCYKSARSPGSPGSSRNRS